MPRAINAVSHVEVPLAHTSRVPTRLQVRDTIASAPPAPERIPLSKPQLSPPQPELLKTFEALWTHAHQRLATHNADLDASQLQTRTLNQEQIKRVQAAAQRAKESQSWSLFRQVGSCVGAALSTIFGISLVGTAAAPVTGGFLIASGVLSITNFAFAEASVWNQIAEHLFPEDAEKRKQFLFYIPASIGLVSAGVGAVGSITSYATLAPNAAQHFSAIAKTALHFVEGTASIGEGTAKARTSHAEAEVMLLNNDLFLHQMNFENIASAFETLLKDLSESYNKAFQLIAIALRSGEEITLQG